MPTLAQFADKHLIPLCTVCRLPQQILEQVEDNELRGLEVPRSLVIQWLKTEADPDQPYHIGESAVRRHRLNCMSLPAVRA